MKAKFITAASMLLAGCGFLASQSDKPTAERRSSPGSEPPAVVRDRAVAPVETPLVEKLLPKAEPNPVVVPDNHKPSMAAPARDETPDFEAPFDGQLSPRGEWQWSEAQWAWVPVKKPGPAWVQDGHSATIDHLVREHGYNRASLENLTQSQLDVLHSNSHNAARAAAPVRSSCPSGNCPNTNVSRGLFGRRR